MFLTPMLAILVVFTLIPALLALILSFTDIRSSDLRDPFAVGFTGLSTFASVLTDPSFLGALGNTFLMVVIGVPSTIVIGFALALALDSGVRRLRGTLRAAYYLPVITNVVAAAVIWSYAFSLSGPVNSALSALGLPIVNWLGQSGSAVGVVTAMAVWRNIGTVMVLFLAGLQAVPEELYEAASLDGAGARRRMLSITVPLLQPTTLLVTVLMTTAFMNMFDEPYLVTGGGPVGSTRTIALWIYQQFGYGNVADSMAGSYVLLIIIMALSLLQFRMLRSRV